MATRERPRSRPGLARPAAGAPRVAAVPAGASNQALQKALRAQAKLDVRPAGDAYEEEADRIADELLSAKEPGSGGPAKAVTPAPAKEGEAKGAGPVQAKPDTPVPDEETRPPAPAQEEEPLQRKAEAGADKEKDKPVQKKSEPADKEKDKPVQKKSAPADKEKDKPVQKKSDPAEKEKPVQREVATGAEKDEEKPVQKKAAEPEKDEPVQKKAAEPEKDEPVQRMAADEAAQEEDLPMAQPPEQGTKPEPHAHLEQRLVERESGGMPLDPATRSFFESRLGRGLDTVRVHTDAEAARLAADLGAQAFTRGAHIYFAEGRYDPGSRGGKRLLAHELVHVLQQGAAGKMPTPPAGAAGAVPAKPVPVSMGVAGVQRSNGNQQPQGLPNFSKATTGLPSLTGPPWTIEFEELPVPEYKLNRHAQVYGGRMQRPANYNRTANDQVQVWRNDQEAKVAEAKRLLHEKSVAVYGPSPPAQVAFRLPAGRRPQGLTRSARERVHGQPSPRAPGLFYMGTEEEIAKQLVIPVWDSNGNPRVFQVDHKKELQIEGNNTPDNMELLDAGINASMGYWIQRAIAERADDFAQEARKQRNDPADPAKYRGLMSKEGVKRNATLVFERGVRGAGGQTGPRAAYWARDQIEHGNHIRPLEAVNLADMDQGGTFYLLTDPMGGFIVELTPQGSRVDTSALGDLFHPYEVKGNTLSVGVNQAGSNLGMLNLELKPDPAHGIAGGGGFPLPVNRVEQRRFMGAIDTAVLPVNVRSNIRNAWFSPIQVDSARVGPGGLVAPGRIEHGLTFLGGPIPFTLEDGGFTIAQTFSTDRLQPPPPFDIRAAGITIEASSATGLSVTGGVDFGIDRVGEGRLEARGGTSTPFGFSGEFVFDPSLAENAKVRVTYTKEGEGGKWSGSGSIDLGKRKGIKRGSLAVEYKDETLSATGEAELDVPGFEAGTMSLEVGPEGMAIGGAFKLAQSKGLKSGELTAEVSNKGGDGFKVKAGGTFQPDIPGFDTTLEADYDDGALTIRGTSAFSKGMLSGRIEAGVTNAPVAEDGTAAGKGTGPLRPFGSGEATVKITPWLQGTAGIRIDEKGEVALKGQVAVPSGLEVFKRKEIEKELLSVSFDAPIVGVAVAGQRVGIFLTVGGALSAKAGIGPGRLEDTQITVDYKPSDETATQVSGSARLVVPADAGLTLAVNAGVGAGIPLVSATAGLRVSGTLGIQGRATAAVNVGWKYGEGFKMHAEADFEAQPAFTFDISGYAKVEAGIGPFKADLYSERWSLASYTWGSGMTFGVNFPVDYEQGKEFDVALDDVTFRKPDIEVGSMLKSLIKEIA
jgi:hypothetical protein